MADQVSDLHAAIMNLPCNVPPMVVDDQAYKLGHRDARHAAAELAASHAADVEAADALLRGYSGSTMVSDADGGKLSIFYDNPADAEAAHDALCKLFGARAALKGDKP